MARAFEASRLLRLGEFWRPGARLSLSERDKLDRDKNKLHAPVSVTHWHSLVGLGVGCAGILVRPSLALQNAGSS